MDDFMSMLSPLHLRNTIFDNVESLGRALCGLIMIPLWNTLIDIIYWYIYWFIDIIYSMPQRFWKQTRAYRSAVIEFQSIWLRICDGESGFSIRLKCKNTLKIKFKSRYVSSPSPSSSPSPQVSSPSPSPRKWDSSRTRIQVLDSSTTSLIMK